MSPLPNQGMLPQNNMLLQGRSPNNLQQMMGLQMPVAPNMQLFNAAGLQNTSKGERGGGSVVFVQYQKLMFSQIYSSMENVHYFYMDTISEINTYT